MYENDPEIDDSFFESYGGGMCVPSEWYDEDNESGEDDFCGDAFGSL